MQECYTFCYAMMVDNVFHRLLLKEFQGGFKLKKYMNILKAYLDGSSDHWWPRVMLLVDELWRMPVGRQDTIYVSKTGKGKCLVLTVSLVAFSRWL